MEVETRKWLVAEEVGTSGLYHECEELMIQSARCSLGLYLNWTSYLGLLFRVIAFMRKSIYGYFARKGHEKEPETGPISYLAIAGVRNDIALCIKGSEIFMGYSYRLVRYCSPLRGKPKASMD